MSARRHIQSWSILLTVLLVAWGCDSGTAPPVVGSIQLSPNDPELDLGSQRQLVATVVSETGSVLSGHPVNWSSAQPAVASVTSSGLVAALSVGSTTVSAESGGKSGSILITVRPGECTGATAGSISVGQTLTGTLGPADCSLFPDSRAAGWTLNHSGSTGLRIDLASQNFWPNLLITDVHLNPVAGGQSGGDQSVWAVVELPADEYIVWAFTHESEPAGSYELSVRAIEFCSADLVEETIAPGDAFTRSLGNEDCVLPHGLSGAGFGLSLSESTGMRLELSSAEFDPLLVVTDLEMEVVWWSESRIDTPDAVVEVMMPPGDYIVWVTSFVPSGGSFQLSAEEVEIELCPTVGTLALGATVTGDLTASSCLMNGQRHADPWTLTVSTPTSVRIDLTSGQFDAFLILEDEHGGWLAADDDGGAGVNSRLFYDLPAGEYRVVVTTYAPGETGAYQLVAQELGAYGTAGAMLEQSDPHPSGSSVTRSLKLWTRTAADPPPTTN